MNERVLVYAGLTISFEKVKELIPEAIVMGPAAQSDIISHVLAIDPTHLILIDGRFHQSLPPWHKELAYCLLHPSLQGRVYGASSMGALRAADLARHGMIGYGEVFDWYNASLISDDSEVAISFSVDKDGACVPSTVAMVDVRSTIATLPETENKKLLFDVAKRIHWSERSSPRLRKAWQEAGFEWSGLVVSQKLDDAVGLLSNFRDLPVPGPKDIDARSLTHLFMAQFNRERRVMVGEKEIALEDIDAHIALSNPYGRRVFRDANNRAIALMMCDRMGVNLSSEEVERFQGEFYVLNGIGSAESLDAWLHENACSSAEFQVLMIQEARLTKLHRSLRTSRQYERATADVLYYLRSCNRLDQPARSSAEDHYGESDINPLEPVSEQLRKHAEAHNVKLVGNEAEFALDFGLGSTNELAVALERYGHRAEGSI